MFHSFGYTVTLWTVLTLDPKGVYHYTPLEPRQIGALCRKHGCTILIATPTFLRAYLRRCEPDDLRSLDVVFAGAEKLPPELAAAFHERFGVLPVEGYGATELSPVVSGNRPPSRDPTRIRDAGKCGNRIGTIGQPMAGIDVKVIDVDTGEDLPRGQQGMLLVRGPSVMKGYLNRPDLTAEVMRGDWYVTGDLATIDEDNYISITGRISRFSKIGGEMVPHLRRRGGRPRGPFGRRPRSVNWPSPRYTTRRAASGLSCCTRAWACPRRRFAARWWPAVFRRSGFPRPTVSGRWRPFPSWARASSTCRG